MPAVLGAAAPSLQWLMHNTDRMRGLERVEMYVRQPPVRSEAERAKTVRVRDGQTLAPIGTAEWSNGLESLATAYTVNGATGAQSDGSRTASIERNR